MQQIKNAQANITAQINTATNDINDEIICRSIMYLNENKNNMKY